MDTRSIRHDLTAYSISELENTGRIRLNGRTVPQHQPYYLFWTGSGLELNVNSRTLELELEVSYEKSEPWVTVEIDGTLFSRQMLQPGHQMFGCFCNMGDGNAHRVRFALDSQAAEGTYLCVINVYTDGELLPMPKPLLRLEFVGDSITSGEGLALPDSFKNWATGIHSSARAYHRILAQERDADVHVLSRGGYGVYSAWNNDLHGAMPRYYDAVCGFMTDPVGCALGANAPYDFASWQPDAVVIVLGANDYGACRQVAWIDEDGTAHQQRLLEDGTLEPESQKRLQCAAVQFLQNVRAKNPSARIIWACGVCDAPLAPVIREAVENYVRISGDTDTFYRSLSPITDFVAHHHPGIETHRRMANEISAILNELL